MIRNSKSFSLVDRSMNGHKTEAEKDRERYRQLSKDNVDRKAAGDFKVPMSVPDYRSTGARPKEPRTPDNSESPLTRSWNTPSSSWSSPSDHRHHIPNYPPGYAPAGPITSDPITFPNLPPTYQSPYQMHSMCCGGSSSYHSPYSSPHQVPPSPVQESSHGFNWISKSKDNLDKSEDKNNKEKMKEKEKPKDITTSHVYETKKLEGNLPPNYKIPRINNDNLNSRKRPIEIDISMIFFKKFLTQDILIFFSGNETIKDYQKQIDHASVEIDRLQRVVRENQGWYFERTHRMEREMEEKRIEKEASNKEIKHLQEKTKELEIRLSESKVDLNQCHKQLAEANHKLDEWSQDDEKNEQEIRKFKTQNEDLKEKCEELECK
jgi:hypothetical protein